MSKTVRNAFDRVRVPTVIDGVSMTKQAFCDECDINNIMRQHQKHGLVSHVNEYQGSYTDVTGVVDYHDALNRVQQAQSMFMGLPAALRARFENDAGSFLDFVNDPSNHDAMVEMGLVPRSAVKTEAAPAAQAKPEPEASANKPASKPDKA